MEKSPLHTISEENYLKAIFALTPTSPSGVSTNDIAKRLDTKAASVTDMIKKLADKKLVNYKKYQGVKLTNEGKKVAISTLRKHRLWEYFLVEKLHFKWDEVHEIAEYLEHINSDVLINRLDDFLGNPEFDPHGDPIPDKDGNLTPHQNITLNDLQKDESGVIVGVKDHSSAYLKFLETNGLLLGVNLKVMDIQEFDESVKIIVNQQHEISLSQKASKNLIIRKL